MARSLVDEAVECRARLRNLQRLLGEVEDELKELDGLLSRISLTLARIKITLDKKQEVNKA